MNRCVPEWDVTGGDLDVVMHSADLFSPNKAKWEPTQHRRFNSSDMGSVQDHDFEELCWENGQLLVVMQGQNGKVQKQQRQWSVGPSSNISTLPEGEGAVPTSRLGVFEKDGTLEAVVHDAVGVPDSSGGNNYMQEDEMVSWLQCPLDEPLEKYCTELLTDIPYTNLTQIWKDRGGREATVNGQKNPISSTGSLMCAGHERGSRNTRDSLSKPVPADFAMAVSSSRAPNLTSLASSSSYSKNSSSIHSEVPFKQATGVLVPNRTEGLSASSSVTPSKVIPGSGSAVASSQMPPPKMQPGTSSDHNSLQLGRSCLMNFSHFSRPAATFKANLHAIGMASGSTGTERLKQLDGVAVEACISNDSSIESTITSMSLSGTCTDGNPLSVIPQSLGTTSMWRPLHNLSSRKGDSVSCVNDNAHCSVKAGEASNGWNSCSASNMPLGTDKGTVAEALEPTMTCSSGGSGNSAMKSGKIAGSPEKRKVLDVEDSECQSDDPENELGDVKKPPRTRSTSVKRSRAAEIHNLSERRRRDRINEKMKALQELIPNSNKTDKASLLEEVIEYLKMLQTQLQVMSFRSGMGISPMLIPPGMQHLQMAQLASIPHMGMGMGMGLGMMDMTAAASARHVLPLPSFPGSLIPGSATPIIHGSTIPPTPGSTLPASAVPVPTPGLPGTSVSEPSQLMCCPTSTTAVSDRYNLQLSNAMEYKAYIAHQQLQVPSRPLYNTLMIHQHPHQLLANYSTANPPPQ